MLSIVIVYFLVVVLIAPIIAGFSGWIDVDTLPENKQTKSFTDGKIYDLVMSDEFNRDGRGFRDGHDPMWTGIDKSDDDQTAQGRKSLQFYNSSMLTTRNGNLVISTNTEDTTWKGWDPYLKKYTTLSRHFKSGMIQSWNKFCFTGGIIEFEVQLPGRADVGGLWPAIWLMGNLGRATYEASTNLLWPWSYPTCNVALQSAQEISGCDVTSHFQMQAGKGRGATEIDIMEVMPGPSTPLPFVTKGVHRPYSSMTLQLAPGVPAAKGRPQPGTLPWWKGFHWYSNLTYGVNTSINPFFYGSYLGPTKAQEPIGRSASESYQYDALSSMMTIDPSYFNSKKKIRLEWQPGANGSLNWYVDGKFRYGIEQAGLDEWGTQIPNEPSYVIINTAISTSWGFPNPPYGCVTYDCKNPLGQCGFNPGFCQSLPAEFLIDSVRVYQNKEDSSQTLGCNPQEYPTRNWIEGHEYRYMTSGNSHPLMPIQVGGAYCAGENKNCGEGNCDYWGYCHCNDGWTGPRCLVPDYKNDFPDWDKPQWIPYVPPEIPIQIWFFVFGLAATLLIASVTFARRKRLEDDQTYLLSPTRTPSGGEYELVYQQ